MTSDSRKQSYVVQFKLNNTPRRSLPDSKPIQKNVSRGKKNTKKYKLNKKTENPDFVGSLLVEELISEGGEEEEHDDMMEMMMMIEVLIRWEIDDKRRKEMPILTFVYAMMYV